MPRSCLALVLAAGEGTRMRSSLPKVMHKVAGVPMLAHVLRAAKTADADQLAVVVGKDAETVAEEVRSEASNADVFNQVARLGTAHAVLAARKALEKKPDDVLVLFGDTPLVRPETLVRMRQTLADGADVAVLGFYAADPSGYGRLLITDGRLTAIREEKDASPEECEVDFCNGGIMGISGKHALSLLDAVDNKNAKGEYYLTDIAEIANQKGLCVTAIEADEVEIMGVNTREDLSQVEGIWQENARQGFLLSGVTMIDPGSVFFSADTVLEPDVTIEPNVFFGPGVVVRSGARIKAFSHFEGCTVGEGADVGPFARLRPGTDLGNASRVGNFVEIKNATVHTGAKVNHLTYIGDAEIGERANIGAGTITCNYDGINKHKTTIGQDAFIGSNSALVAPVTIGDGAYIASGSVITQDVPSHGMGIARGKQSNKDGYAEQIREKNQKIKEKNKAR